MIGCFVRWIVGIVSNPSQDRLESWKEIAHHFGVTARTVQLWERERGLPVHRMPGPRGRVYALRAELDEWANGGARETGAPEPAPRTRWHYWLAAPLLILTLSVGWNVYSAGGKLPVAGCRIDGQILIALNKDGAELWRFDLGRPVSKARSEDLRERAAPWAGDLDGDGARELLVLDAQEHRSGLHDRLLCFSERGELRWTFRPGRKVSTRKEPFEPPFRTMDFEIVRLGQGRGSAVLVVSVHEPYYPQQTALISPAGKPLREYWHSGHLLGVAAGDMDRNGTDEIYLAGVSNGYKAATLVVLDPLTMDGASLEANADYQLQGFAPPREVARILLPVSRPARGLAEYAVANTVALKESTIHVAVHEAPWVAPATQHGPSTWFRFSPGLELIGVSADDNYQVGLAHAGRPNERLTEGDLRGLRNITYIAEPSQKGVATRTPVSSLSQVGRRAE